MTPEKTGLLKNSLEEAVARIRRKHEDGASGVSVCEELAQAVDRFVLDLFSRDSGSFNGALVALGGYGRGVLNPHSDVDLLFLLNNSGREKARPPETLLANLWDLGLKVGHSARTIPEAVAHGREDLASRTSMMESRFLAGDRGLYDSFYKTYNRDVTRYKPEAFINEKIEEMELRRAAHGRVVWLTEPNLKESAGGLRDYHAAMWVIRTREDVDDVDGLARTGIINAAQAGPVKEAHSFLLRLRNSLHWLTGRQQDVLAHEWQPDVARAEGIGGDDNEAAVELMRRYYRAAETIANFNSDIITTARRYKRHRLWRAPRVDADGLFSDGTHLHAKSFPPDDPGDDPGILLRIAERISAEGLEPAANLRRGLAKLCENAPSSWFEGENAGRALLDILRLPESAGAVDLLRGSGMLSRFVPEFGQVKGLSQFDMFHRYTVDEHTIRALRNLENVPHGAPVCSELRGIFRSLPDLETVKLAVLLHDLGKGEDEPPGGGEERTRAILERLGLGEYARAVSFLVVNHLLMSDTAQKLNFSVPETLRSFCGAVGGRMNLKMLYLLTYADISAVGPDIWNDWKDKLLLDLFEAAEKYFIEGESLFLSGPEQMKALVEETSRMDGFAGSAGEVEEFLARAPDMYLRNATPEDIMRQIGLVERLAYSRIAIDFRLNPGDRTGEFTLASVEKIGFFSIVAGAFSAKDMNIIETSVNTFRGHLAIDTITVEGTNLSMYSDGETLTRFENELGDLLEGKKDVGEMVARRARYMPAAPAPKAAALEPQALILDHLSDENTVVEMWAPDRMELLYDATRTMAELGLDIDSAKTSTQGRVAINVFYVKEASGGKVSGDARKKEIAGRLLAAIS